MSVSIEYKWQIFKISLAEIITKFPMEKIKLKRVYFLYLTFFFGVLWWIKKPVFQYNFQNIFYWDRHFGNTGNLGLR